MTTTRLTGRLPNLDVEIVRRETDDGREAVGITFIATPTLGHAAAALLSNPAALALAALPAPGGSAHARAGMDPFGLWWGMMEAAWRPWLDMAGAANPFLAAAMGAARRR
ncbi:hypothetical protein C882_0823 [Caenispirillum salinarum AK4]|uniref:Uncharacterized protein n=1 Tax=Caenispirillum salinarum AK4 TaxID=1238182 RepID=K9GTY6_9PROT|nr:hypothetical protein [Caenispirillum salinarum]EKV28612.1 hypothetical protein C882_0823 [Caenispirillum salinarum AK4]